jgi:D-amino-acid dehydrogenase
VKVVVLGSGVIGLTSAYSLIARGLEVAVIERRNGPAVETSFANAALLTPSMSSPWNEPGIARTLISSLGKSDAAVALRLPALPSLAVWGCKFLRHSRRLNFARNTLNNLQLGQYSLKAMQALKGSTGIEYSCGPAGNLRIFSGAREFERARSSVEEWSKRGVELKALSAEQASELEPALKPILSRIAGAIHSPDDETGDAYEFSRRLAEYLRSKGVEFQFSTEVEALVRDGRRVAAAVTSKGRVVADHFVVACASHSAALVRPLGVKLPIRPVKGYSLTFHSLKKESLPSIPIIDDLRHAVVVPIGEKIRVAGTAEFAGFDLTIRQDGVRKLEAVLKEIVPQLPIEDHVGTSWCGLRAMSVDGVPMIGATSIDNLFVNTGHGHLGWTMAAGAAELLADVICRQSPIIDPAAYSVARFTR